MSFSKLRQRAMVLSLVHYYRSFSLSRNKNFNWKLSGGRSQENEMLNNLSKSQVFVAHSFWVIYRTVSRPFVELCMETPHWCTEYGRLKLTKIYGVHVFHKSSSILAHKHFLKWLYCWKLRFNKTAFLFWCHALWKLGNSNCCIFEMKQAMGMETGTKIYFLLIFKLV